jgi:hypothetical protein
VRKYGRRRVATGDERAPASESRERSGESGAPASERAGEFEGRRPSNEG